MYKYNLKNKLFKPPTWIWNYICYMFVYRVNILRLLDTQTQVFIFDKFIIKTVSLFGLKKVKYKPDLHIIKWSKEK